MSTPVSYKYDNDNFPKSGYTIIFAQMENDSYDAVKLKVMNHSDDEYEPIFKDCTDSSDTILSDDRFQSKTIVNGTSSDPHWAHMKRKIEVQLKLIHKARETNGGLKMKLFAALWSKAGCAQQVDHTDFKPQDVPLYSGILSFDAKTKLTIFGRNGSPIDVYIPPGCFILFSADCRHAGSQYAEENKRLFFKVMPSNFTLTDDETKTVNKKKFQCPYCPLGGGDSEAGLKHHIDFQCKFASSVISDEARKAKVAKKSAYNKKAYEKKKNANSE